MSTHTRTSQRTRGLRALLVAILIALFAASCASVDLATPEGFARFSDADGYVGMSPDGVYLRARLEANEPQQTLEFWQEVLDRHMRDSGYLPLNDGEFESAAGTGYWAEWLAPVGEEDWIYLTAIAVSGADIAIVESAGPAAYFRERREAVYEAMESVQVR